MVQVRQCIDPSRSVQLFKIALNHFGKVGRSRGLLLGESEMPIGEHPLMENANDLYDAISSNSIEDHMLALQILPIARANLVARSTGVRPAGNRPKPIVELLKIASALGLSPPIAGVGSNLNQVQLCSSGNPEPRHRGYFAFRETFLRTRSIE